jgi:multiple sugar transport system substrate-binding protein
MPGCGFVMMAARSAWIVAEGWFIGMPLNMIAQKRRLARRRWRLCVSLWLLVMLAACGATAAPPAAEFAPVPEPSAPPAAAEAAPVAPASAVPARKGAPPAATDLAPACGAVATGEPDPGATTTLRYFTFSAEPNHCVELGQMIAAFRRANPGISIIVETAPFEDYFSQLDQRIAAGTPPDVFELNLENFVAFAARDALLDLTPLAAGEPGFAEQFYPRPYAAFSYDGYQYGLPASFSDVVLFYNQDLFDAAQMPYPTAKWTWQDELFVAQKLTNRAASMWGTSSPIHFWEFYKTAAQNGCAVFGATPAEVTINEPGCVQALQWMVDKIRAQRIAPDDLELNGQSAEELFMQGRVAMVRTGIWSLSQFQALPFRWDIALEPGGRQKAHHFFANGVVVAAQTPQPDAAWQWARFIASSPEAARIRLASNWELPALTDQSLVDEWLTQRPPESREVVFQALDTLVMPPAIEQEAELTRIINDRLAEVKAGTATPQQALDQAKLEIEALVLQ